MLTADELGEVGVTTRADAADLAEATITLLDTAAFMFAPRIPRSSPVSRGSKRVRRTARRR
ncbi:hypothetical protein J2Y69_001395 [Microbacterium resistens]|uniref:Uncharacterized protein n=1 Tax=Microbacterium resistens TaxID=156977 RepID=A0ABU1SB65_9MICO|nr:hypothetical protein [Microbacterium resistens]MDR6866796.1 hypothetical protein [Microbacterium resistens]